MLHQEVDRIISKRLRAPWPKFITSVTVSGLRGWTGQVVRFPFPVCAIAGENGSGKSTVLKALASLYDDPSRDKKKRFFPSDFFPQTAWDQVTGVEINFNISEGANSTVYTIKKPTARWRLMEPRPSRHVIWQDISRTLPISAEVGYAKIANSLAREISSDVLDDDLKGYYSSIMGKRYTEARWSTADADPEKQIGVVSVNGFNYSQFHQGAGEDATFDLLSLLQVVPSTSLVLIDEIEASLHPRSQRRLMHFLLWVARTKHVQVVVSTHSPYILSELPEEGRILIERGTNGPVITYGPSPEYALNKMDDHINPQLYVFAEDSESIVAAQAILRALSVDIQYIKFIAVGPSNDVSSAARVAQNRDFPITAVGVLDADKSAMENCAVLPGNRAPEIEIFSAMSDKIDDVCARLQKSNTVVRDALDQTLAVDNHHQWPQFFAERIGESATYIWETFCRIWAARTLTEEEKRNFCQTLLPNLDT